MKNRGYWLLIKNWRDKHRLKGTEKWQRDLQSHTAMIDSFFSFFIDQQSHPILEVHLFQFALGDQ